MRIGILLKDIEFRDALIDRLSSYNNNIYVKILDNTASDISDFLILTDITPDEIDRSLLDSISCRTVFMTRKMEHLSSDNCCGSEHSEYHYIFKYSSVGNLISELSRVYSDWKGGSGRSCSAKIISVCCESDSFSADKCISLARQIIYRCGGKVLIIPMSYINDYGLPDSEKSNSFARLMYSIRKGRTGSADSFTYTDCYGLSYLMIPPGQNPIAYLDEDEINTLINGTGRYFDTVILDIATAFRKENILLMNDSEYIVSFENGRRNTGLADMTGKGAADRLIRIRITGDTEEALAIDDSVKRIFRNKYDEDF